VSWPSLFDTTILVEGLLWFN